MGLSTKTKEHDMTTATIPAPPDAPPARLNPRGRGWIPASDIDWLEQLRDEHERAVEACRQTLDAIPALERRVAALRAKYDAQVVEAAVADVDPPAFPGRLGEDYQRVQ